MNPRLQLNFSLAAVVTIFVSRLSVGAFASDPSALEADLQSKYLGKAFTLRGFYADDHLRFDSSGNPQGNVHPGSWTTSLIAIQRVKISADKVELKGLRFAELYDPKQLKFVPVRTKLDVTLVVDRDPAAQADDSVLSAIERIFLGPNERLLAVAPDYWKAVLSGAWETVPQKKGPDCHRIKGALQRTVGGDIVAACEENAKTKSSSPPKTNAEISTLPYYYYGVNGGKKGAVVSPTVLFDPAPEYSDVAKSLKFQGDILLQFAVTSTGDPSDIAVLRPIGCGLDDQAVRAVRTWKFKPATLKGIPVPVQIEVEVSFNMQ